MEKFTLLRLRSLSPTHCTLEPPLCWLQTTVLLTAWPLLCVCVAVVRPVDERAEPGPGQLLQDPDALQVQRRAGGRGGCHRGAGQSRRRRPQVRPSLLFTSICYTPSPLLECCALRGWCMLESELKGAAPLCVFFVLFLVILLFISQGAAGRDEEEAGGAAGLHPRRGRAVRRLPRRPLLRPHPARTQVPGAHHFAQDK